MADEEYGKMEYRSEHTTTTTTTTSSSGGVSFSTCPPEYIKTPFGILKIIELVLTIIAFACSLGGHWSSWAWGGAGWVEFVTISSFITTAIWFVLHLLNLIQRMPTFCNSYLIEFISYCVMAGLLLIAAIVAATRGSIPQVGAAAFFTFAAVVAYSVETFFLFRDWRSGTSSTMATSTSATSSTTQASPHY